LRGASNGALFGAEVNWWHSRLPGAILKRGGRIHGISTRASIWSTAAMGAVVAYHKFELPVILSFVTFVTLR
jgi:uncharacterized membrane protein YhiD involved in acid resistance